MNTPALTGVFRNAYASLVRVASSISSLLLLVLRLYWGWSFFQAGKGTLMNLSDTAEFFATLHLPFSTLNAFLAGRTEGLGGLLLLVSVIVLVFGPGAFSLDHLLKKKFASASELETPVPAAA